MNIKKDGITIKGDFCTVEGNNCTISGDYAKVTGDNCTIRGDFCKATGNENVLRGDYCEARGLDNLINGAFPKYHGNKGFSVRTKRKHVYNGGRGRNGVMIRNSVIAGSVVNDGERVVVDGMTIKNSVINRSVINNDEERGGSICGTSLVRCTVNNVFDKPAVLKDAQPRTCHVCNCDLTDLVFISLESGEHCFPCARLLECKDEEAGTESDDSTVCIICYTNVRKCKPDICGHFAYCFECAEKLIECGVCKKDIITGYVRVIIA